MYRQTGYRNIITVAYVRDRAWSVYLYGEIIPSFSEGIIDRTSAQAMLYPTCTIISRLDLAHYDISRAKDWVSVYCGTRCIYDPWKRLKDLSLR